MMMSAPEPDWMAAVMRGCRSLALIVSSWTSTPSALPASGRSCWRRIWSPAGRKSTQGNRCTFVPRAKAGERLVELAPHGLVLPLLGRADRITLLRGEPLAVVLRLVQPAQEVLGQLLILAVLHDRVRLVEEEQVRPSGAGRERRVIDVLEQRLALVVLDLVLLTLGDDVDRRAVQRRADLAGVERAVVVGVVPGQAALVAAFLPERLHELHRLEGALAIDGDLLAGLVGLGPAERPEHRVREGRSVAEGVAQRLAVRLALLLEGSEDLARLVPRLRELAGAGLLEPRPAIGNGVADDRVRHRQPLAVDLARRRPDAVEAPSALATSLTT